MPRNRRRILDTYVSDRRRDSLAYTDDADVAETFDDLAHPAGLDAGSREMCREERFEQGLDRDLLAGDADASLVDVIDASVVGQEGVGSALQPVDTSSVDEIAHAIGIEYRDNEPLESNRKMRARDGAIHRWELDPESSEDWPRDV